MKLYLIILILCTSCDVVIVNKNDIKKLIQESMEQGYFEGQKDFMYNDIRIQHNHDGCWVWIKSPWDNGDKPIFNPSLICNEIR